MRNKNFDNGGLCTGGDYCKDKEPLLSRDSLDYELNRLVVICELKRGISEKNDEIIELCLKLIYEALHSKRID